MICMRQGADHARSSTPALYSYSLAKNCLTLKLSCKTLSCTPTVLQETVLHSNCPAKNFLALHGKWTQVAKRNESKAKPHAGSNNGSHLESLSRNEEVTTRTPKMCCGQNSHFDFDSRWTPSLDKVTRRSRTLITVNLNDLEVP